MVETNQKWQKTDKNDRKPWKMWSFTNYLLPSSHFCPAKLPLLSCQAAISVLPSSHFCPAKLTNFSKGRPRPPPPPPLLRLWSTNYQDNIYVDYLHPIYTLSTQAWSCWCAPSTRSPGDSTSCGPRSFPTTAARSAPSGCRWMSPSVCQCSLGQTTPTMFAIFPSLLQSLDT